MSFPWKRFQNPDASCRMLKIDHSYASPVLPSWQREPSFQNPAEYLHRLQELGYGGLVTNVSTAQDYLESDEMWNFFRQRIQLLNEQGMRLWLYDENGYPSGTAGGLTLRDHPEWEAIAIVCQSLHLRGERLAPMIYHPEGCQLLCAAAYRGTCEDDIQIESRIDLSSFILPDGKLHWDTPDGDWMIFLFYTRPIYEYCVPEQRHGDGVRRGINLMERDAGDYFVQITHSRYFEKAGDLLDGKLEAFFTDEPSFMTYTYSEDAYVGDDQLDKLAPDIRAIPRLAPVPWKWDMPALFERRFGYALTTFLPYLFGGTTPKAVQFRRDYYVLASELAANGFFGACSEFCAAHKVDFSGHLLLEECIHESAITQGNFFPELSQMQRPGIDMITATPKLCRVEALAGKLASSVAHLNGRKHVFCEISNFKDGMRGQSLDPIQARNVLQLLAAQGVDTFASYYSMEFAGNQTAEILDATARLSALLEETQHQADVALFYPIESIFGHTLPSSRGIFTRPYSAELMKYSSSFHESFDALLDAQLDMELIDDEFLMRSQVRDGLLHVPGGETFRVLVLPEIAILRLSLAEKLVEFAESGLPILLLGQQCPLALMSEKDWQLAETYDRLRRSALHCSSPADLPGRIRGLFGADFTLTEPCKDLNICHRVGPEYDAYLLVNFSAQDHTFSGTVRATGQLKAADPVSATVAELPSVDLNGYTPFSLSIPAFSARILILEHP